VRGEEGRGERCRGEASTGSGHVDSAPAERGFQAAGGICEDDWHAVLRGGREKVRKTGISFGNFVFF
jgi:hypothetical protein